MASRICSVCVRHSPVKGFLPITKSGAVNNIACYWHKSNSDACTLTNDNFQIHILA